MDNELKWLLTLVPWTLQRLLRKEFEVTCDTNGMPEALEMDQRYGPSTEKMEEDLKAIAHTWPGLEDLSAVRDHLTPERISEALAKIPLPPAYLPREELLHADWPDIVASVYWAHCRFSKDLLLATIDSRIGLGGSIAEKFETRMQWLRPDALPAAAAEYVVREMSESFPRIVERISTFQVIPVTDAAPSTAKHYAREACRCYLHGFFSASLILCRSCIEAGVVTKLDQKDLQKAREALPYGNMEKLLKLALKEEVLDGLTFSMANEIRERANRTVHQSAVPSGEECRDMLEQTRAVLRHLYE
ncbi:hypothetical protein SBA4_3230016 [Candidatus Sulfopaludibacter sp. SbA4]|nr:hypothetical protein SBA4_3230016 [Candidatus Sulfopaludibacter sp. SbA4]